MTQTNETTARHMKQNQTAEIAGLIEWVRNCLTPHTVALLIAHIRPACTDRYESFEGREARDQIEWLADLLETELGGPRMVAILMEEVGI